MSEKDNIPTEDEYAELDELFSFINENEDIRPSVRLALAGFLKPIYQIPKHRTDILTRLMAKPSIMRDRKLVAAAYDFALERMGAIVATSDSATDHAKGQVVDMVATLRELRTRRLNGRISLNTDMESHSNLIKHIQPVNGFAGDYFGYRRSSTQEEIIRFSFKITPINGGDKVRFFNEYIRGGMHWKVTGSGYCIRDTLYVSGHADNAEDVTTDNPESFGMRFLALRMLWDTPCLNGLVISMASEGKPIAARVLLVPKKEHKFSEELLEMRRSDERKWELHMLQTSPDYKYEVEPQLRHVFRVMRPDYFLELIRNGTTSVLKTTPMDNPAIARKEEIIRQHCVETDQDIDDVLSRRYEIFLDDTLADLQRKKYASG